MFGIGAQELAIILAVALLVFGPKRLPELARTLGRGLAEFRRASSDLRQSIQLESEPERPPTPNLQTPPPPPADDATPPQSIDSAADPKDARDEAKEPTGG